MSDDFPEDLPPIDVTSEGQPGAAPTSTFAPAGPSVASWPLGWYADPWTAGQYRFWNGEAWTGETHRSGPSTTTYPAGAPATSAWASSPPGSGASGAVWPVTVPASGGRGSRAAVIVAALVVLVLIAGAIGYAVESNSKSKDTAKQAEPQPSTTLPAGSASPPNATDRDALARLVVRQADVGSASSVLLIPGGNRTTQPTLDLCNGTFASEKLRTARLQVAEVDASGRMGLSTEAVVYRNAAASATAFGELRKVVAKCPHAPVKSPVGEGTAETVFKAAPDGSWSQTPYVERLAYRFDTTQAGTTSSSVAVYLRRGRVLLGLYFPDPSDPQPAVAGQTSIKGIVGVFAQRMARLPASVTN